MPEDDERRSRRVRDDVDAQFSHEPQATLSQLELETFYKERLGFDLRTAIRLVAWPVAIRVTGSPQDAEDLVHDSLIKVLAKADDAPFASPGEARAYIRKAVTNTWISEIRYRTAAKRTPPGGVSKLPNASLAALEIVSSDESVEEIAERSALDQQLLDVVNMLPPGARQLAMLALHGRTKDEISDMLGINPRVINSRISSVAADIRSGLRRSGWSQS